jgi:hypothetical protein
MSGNPYKLNSFTKQYGIYNIDSANFLYIDKIYIFCYDFITSDEDKKNDIFVSDIEFSCVNKTDNETLNSYGLNIKTPKGLYFDETSLDSDTVELQASIQVKGRAIDSDSQFASYYWFIENTKINNKSEKYCSYGGQGWECLNDYNVIDEEIVE